MAIHHTYLRHIHLDRVKNLLEMLNSSVDLTPTYILNSDFGICHWTCALYTDMSTPWNATWFNMACLPEVDTSGYVVFFHGNKMLRDTKYTTCGNHSFKDNNITSWCMGPHLYNSSLLCDVNTCQLDHMLRNFASCLPILLNLPEVHKMFHLKL